MSVFSCVMCCISLSENPDDLAQYVSDIVAQTDAKLVLVDVTVGAADIARRVGGMASLEKAFEESRKAQLATLAAYARKHFGPDCTIVQTEGRTADELLKIIDKHCADLLVIGSMSTKGIMGSMFGCGTGSIIGKSRIPVMVIPNDLSLECTPDF